MQIQHTNVIDALTVDRIKRNNKDLIVTNWTGDVRNTVPNTYKKMAMVSDYNLISSVGQLDMFRKQIGKEIHYWQIGFDPKVHHPSLTKPSNFSWDAIFIGNHGLRERYPGAQQRDNTCRLLQQHFGERFALFGGNWSKNLKSKGSIPQTQACAHYHKSLCAVSVSHYNDLSHYFSDRLLMCMASGRPTISFRFPGWESFFADGCDLLIADTVEEIPKKVEYLKNNRDHAEYIGAQGAAKVFAEHTYFSRVNELLELVGLK